VHVQITETGLIHTPHLEWKKDFVLILTLGSSSEEEAKPVIDLFQFIVKILGPENRLHIIVANRLGVVKQVVKSTEELKDLYSKLALPVHLAENDFERNQNILNECFELGKILSV
jgi:hypothetical protein